MQQLISHWRILWPIIRGSKKRYITSLLIHWLIVCLWCWITLIGWFRHTKGQAHRATYYSPCRGLGGMRLEAQILGRWWKRPPRTFIFMGCYWTSLRITLLDIEVKFHWNILWMLMQALLCMICSLEFGANFPHHDQVANYFCKHLYVEFMLHMKLDYVDTRSHYYGPNMGFTYEREGAYSDPRHVPPLLRFLPLLSRSLVLPTDVEELS